MSGRNRPYKFIALGGVVVAIGAASVQQTGLEVGKWYRFTAAEDGCVCRWGTTDAAPADGSFDFAVVPGDSVDVVAAATAIEVEEISAASAATAALFIQELDYGY